MGTFFAELGEPKIKLSFKEIIPGDVKPGEIREDAVYVSYISTITRYAAIDNRLENYRQKALTGELSTGDYIDLDELLKEFKEGAKDGTFKNFKGEATNTSEAYALVKSCALFIAQVLFVNNSVKEGLLTYIEKKSKSEVIPALSACIKRYSDDNVSQEENREPLQHVEIDFYTTLFILQAAFDKIFVPDEDIVQYKKRYGQYTGEYKVTSLYPKATLYLKLTNKRVIAASKEEKKLCYNITTGWGENIDPLTWNGLNQYYYNEMSATTRKRNLFASIYDIKLDRMLPQFALSKVKLAEEILKNQYKRYKKGPLNIIEIGAGSGSFAIDLMMACKREKIDAPKICYRGLEPNDKMRRKFKENIEQKAGVSRLPQGWELVEGDMETFVEHSTGYLNGNNTVIVLCYSAHHCFHESIENLLKNKEIQENAVCIYILDVVKEHGWTKPYYMWADCESPENFDNVAIKGEWESSTLWQEPNLPIEGYALTNAWCNLRKLTAPPGLKRRIPMKESYIKLNENNEEYIFLRHNSLKKGGKTLLFVHGLGESGLCFQEVFDHPRFDAFNILIPDLIGYGRSSGASGLGYGFEQQAERLWQLVEHFNKGKEKLIDKLVVIGHSMGGDITTLFCGTHLDTGMIEKYVNIEGDITPYELFISGQAVKAGEKGGGSRFETWLKEEFANEVYYEYADKSGEALQRYYASLMFCRPEAFLENAEELCKRNRAFHGEEIESEIGKAYISLSKKIPTKFCYGTESLKCETICFLKNQELDHEAFKGAGHWLMIDKKEEFYQFLYDFASMKIAAKTRRREEKIVF